MNVSLYNFTLRVKSCVTLCYSTKIRNVTFCRVGWPLVRRSPETSCCFQQPSAPLLIPRSCYNSTHNSATAMCNNLAKFNKQPDTPSMIGFPISASDKSIKQLIIRICYRGKSGDEEKLTGGLNQRQLAECFGC